jgi:hypothetical protein
LEPPNPSYVRKGSNATLVWQYSVDDKQAELQGIVFSVLNSNVFTGMVARLNEEKITLASALDEMNQLKGTA